MNEEYYVQDVIAAMEKIAPTELACEWDRVGLMIGGGGSLDVFSGAAKRAPEAWIKLNLEGLYRLLSDPRRLGRMMQLPRFLLCAVTERREEP